MVTEKQDQTVRYNDIAFFILFIPVVNGLNYYLTYTDITFSGYTLITFLIDTIEGYTAWWVIRLVILYFDKTISYRDNALKRIALQLFFSSASGLLVIVVLTELINSVVRHTPVPANFYRYDLFIFLIWFFVLNGIYVALYYYDAMRKLELLRQDEKKVRANGFSIKDSRHNTVLPFEDIIAFYTDDDYTAVITKDEKRYLFDSSLEKVERSLPSELFFRVNRQYIVHRHTATGFTKIGNGKLSVSLAVSPYLPGHTQVSRIKASDFKCWFGAAISA